MTGASKEKRSSRKTGRQWQWGPPREERMMWCGKNGTKNSKGQVKVGNGVETGMASHSTRGEHSRENRRDDVECVNYSEQKQNQ